MVRRLVILLMVLFLIGCAVVREEPERGASPSGKKVSVFKTTITIPTYEMDDDDPYPRFDEWKSDAPIYPYPLKLSGTMRKRNKEYIALVLENEYLQVVVLPELGGRLYQFYDKLNKRDIIYTNRVVKPGYFAVRGGWISGGFEFNFPQAHSTTTICPIDYAIRENPDGSASIIVSDVERQYRMKWQVILTLFPGKRLLRQDTKLINRTHIPQRYHWWTIVAVSPNDNTQVIFPTARIINHPQEYVLTWPIWHGRDISRYKTLLHRFGTDWSVLEPWDGFFCYYDHGIEAGLVHVGNKYTIGGSKYFSYCNTTSGRFHSAYSMTDEDGPYDEIDSSPFLTQIDFEILEPFGVRSFSEYWYPVNGTWGLKKANEMAALNLVREDNRIKVALNVNSAVIEGHLIVKAGEVQILDEKIALLPGQVYRKELAPQDGTLSAVLYDSAGKEIISFVETYIDESKLTPEGPVKKDERALQELTVEELCLRGKNYLASEMPNKALECFEEALKKDPGCTSALTEMGIIYLKRGLWRQAESKLKASLERDPHQGRSYYYLGLVHRYMGDGEQATHYFWRAVRYPETYVAGYRCLGEMALSRGDFEEAIEHFKKALSRNLDVMETWGLLSIAHRRLGRYSEAAYFNERIRREEPTDHLAAFERYLLAKAQGIAPDQALADFRALMRDNDHAYSELAWLYAGSGLYPEAIEVIELIVAEKKKDVFPLLHYQLGYLYEQAEKDAPCVEERIAQCFRDARARLDWRYVFPNRLEEFALLNWVLTRQPDDYYARHALGNLLASRYRYDEAIAEFRAIDTANAEDRLEKPLHAGVLAVVYRNLAFLLWKTQKAFDEASRFYRIALDYDGDNNCCFLELSDLYEEQGQREKAIAILERGLDRARDPSDIVIKLAGLYQKEKMFDKIIEMAPKYSYDCSKGLAVQRFVRDARLRKGKNFYMAGDFESAVAELEKATTLCPENIPVMGQLVREFSEILWWRGCAYEKLGRIDAAMETWAQAEKEQHEPISPLTFFQALCLQKIGKTEKARELLEDMMFFGRMYATRYPFSGPHKNVNLAAYIYLQALAHEGMGETAAAAELYKKVLELVPEHEDAMERLQAEALRK